MRKKSKYRPKGVRLDTVNWVLSGMQKVGKLPTAGVGLKLKNHEALIRIRDDLGADWAAEIKAAQDAIYTMGKRGVEKGSFAFTGPEMTALKLVMDVHDAQLDNCTVKEMEMALNIVSEEIRLKKCRPIVEMA
jgi:hypothetical protein